MSFTGKATYTAGATLPEIHEDVSDLVSIVAPAETPLLDILGDPLNFATSTRHEWLEDELLPNTDAINQPGISDPSGALTSLVVAHGNRFRPGDQIQAVGKHELMLVNAVSGNTLTVTRGYGGTGHESLTDGNIIHILGNAALEGDDAGAARFSCRSRKSNYTQIFSAAVQVSGTEAAVRQIGIEDEMDYTKTLRLRELLRDLENTVINGIASDTTPEGSSSVRRTMRGIIRTISTNVLSPGTGFIEAADVLTEGQINGALRTIWENSGAKADLIVCGGGQKRRINSFIQPAQRFSAGAEQFKNLVNIYESDYGVCRVILSRFVPADTVLFLDSSRISVLPLSGRSFQFKPLASAGDYESGELLGEYTLELRNEKCHAILRGLTA